MGGVTSGSPLAVVAGDRRVRSAWRKAGPKAAGESVRLGLRRHQRAFETELLSGEVAGMTGRSGSALPMSIAHADGGRQRTRDETLDQCLEVAGRAGA